MPINTANEELQLAEALKRSVETAREDRMRSEERRIALRSQGESDVIRSGDEACAPTGVSR